MKKIYSIVAGLLLTVSVFGQAPQKMSYQAVIRNSSSALVTSTSVGMKISVLQGSSTGTVAYSETQTISTNANGLVSLEIGSGSPLAGTFAGINWATGPYFIKTETDPTGGTTYSITGTSQLMSVPYALFSASGTTGAQGIQGIQGLSGANGTNGTIGATGLTGATGAVGATGAAGTNGTNGLDGATGAAGTNGTNGLDGATGAAGTNGTNGLDGATGAAGTNGTNGVVGATGAAGTNGANGLVGATGAAGTNGTDGLDGATGTTGATGAAGTNGANGLDGATGAAGTNGANGLDGATGAAGTNGATGTSGADGATGLTGATGAIGATGAAGTNGADGATGLTGTVGIANGGTNITTYAPGDILYATSATELTKLPAGTAGQVLTMNTGATAPEWVAGTTPTYTVNTFYAALGGYVIEINADGTHGLIAAMQDQGISNWYEANDLLSNADNHDVNGAKFKDWRIPTKRELNLMYVQRASIGGASSYWSSTEGEYDNAWGQFFGTFNQFFYYKGFTYNVRAVRAF
jgi:hypothetical protein